MDTAGERELRTLGTRLRALRIASGLSQRALVRRVGLSAHSNLVDYELGRRLPPADVVAACQRALSVEDDELLRLRSAVLAARAVDASRPKGEPVAPARSGNRARGVVLAAAVTAAALFAGAVALTQLRGPVKVPRLALAAGPAPAWVSNCDAGAVVLERAALAGRFPPPGGRTPAVGELALRYSPSCSLAWARFLPTTAATGSPGSVLLSVHRPGDGATAALTLPRVGGVESDPLLTVPGCVYAQVTVAFAGGPPVTARTRCSQG